jgi:hypothetical protein
MREEWWTRQATWGSGGTPERRVNVGVRRRAARRSDDHGEQQTVAGGASAVFRKHCARRRV